MEARVTLRPGKRGTIKWLNQYGERLVCVRYRYDPDGRRRLTTVELIVDESPWDGRPKVNDNRLVGIKVRYDETGLRHQVKQAGGIWRPDRRVWALPLKRVRALGLEARIAASATSERRL